MRRYMNCAIREFSEETGVDISSASSEILKVIKPINENFVGSNGVNYRHIYYISFDENQKKLMSKKKIKIKTTK